ncbi:MAG: glycosyltransferase family 4 protein [Halioglobus sp.]
MREIIYICGGRSFYSSKPGRKIGEVVKCWRNAGHGVRHVCGGDVLIASADGLAPPASYGSQSTYTRWYRRLPGIQAMVHSFSEWRDIQHDKKFLKFLRQNHASKDLLLVWERSSRLHSAGLCFARQSKLPYVLEWKDHLVDYDTSLFRHRALKLEALKNQQADYIVVESGVLKQALEQEGLDPRKLLVAHNAVDVGEFSRSQSERARVRAELGVDDDVVLAGYLGSYAFYHDTPRLVKAAALIAEKELDQQVKVLMVGAGKEYQECRALAEELGVLDETLLMLPGVPKGHVPSVLCALDIAVLPGSTDIICPIKVQEYMASLLPTVAPDYACNREVLCDGVTGELFAPKDTEALASKILLLAKDEARRLRMGHQARGDAANRFSWQSTWGAAMAFILEEIDS